MNLQHAVRARYRRSILTRSAESRFHITLTTPFVSHEVNQGWIKIVAVFHPRPNGQQCPGAVHEDTEGDICSILPIRWWAFGLLTWSGGLLARCTLSLEHRRRLVVLLEVMHLSQNAA